MTEHRDPTEHERLGVLAAGFVLGALPPHERREFETHLSRCSICSEEVAASVEVPEALSRVHAEEVAALDHPDELALRRLLAAAQREWVDKDAPVGPWPVRSRFSRLRSATALVAAAAVGALVTVLTMGLWSTAGTVVASPMHTIAPATIAGTAAFTEHPWGTDVEIRCRDDSGTLAGKRLALVAVDTSGRRTTTATWTAVRSTDVVVRSSTSEPRSSISQLAVEDPDGRTLMELSAT